VDAIAMVERGRALHAERAWSDAYEALSRADQMTRLEAEDLELLATSAYMLGRRDEYFGALERAHQAHLNAGEPLRATRCAFWVGMNLAQQGEMGRANGWLGRARRLVERERRECVEKGYLLMPLVFQQEASGDLDAAIATAAEAARIGERFGDRDLLALAGHQQGHVLITRGRSKEGLALLDEAMVAVTNGELSPIVSGIVYCGVILGCQAAYELRRAREWTATLAEWCEQQPDMVAFTGRCLVHRTEILRLQGAWVEALEEARRAGERCVEGKNQRAAGEAAYLQGDLHRLQGRFAAAEEAYREANQRGREPQPGLALLRLAQRDTGAAVAAIRRVLGETTQRPKRASLLPAFVEIMLAVGQVQEARSACLELDEIAADYQGGMLDAVVAYAVGAVDQADGNAEAALVMLRRASEAWQDFEAPYEAARARALVAQACRTLGDDDAAAMELDAASEAFAKLGAAPDIARIEALAAPAASRDVRGLTPRELEVLRLVAAGQTNKAIAAELVLSERTVERHVSNLFVKLGVSSRAAATAFAYEHQLL
jgi:ATP/maltotriose-dependent transcriptional regulator MalT